MKNNNTLTQDVKKVTALNWLQHHIVAMDIVEITETQDSYFEADMIEDLGEDYRDIKLDTLYNDNKEVVIKALATHWYNKLLDIIKDEDATYIIHEDAETVTSLDDYPLTQWCYEFGEDDGTEAKDMVIKWFKENDDFAVYKRGNITRIRAKYVETDYTHRGLQLIQIDAPAHEVPQSVLENDEVFVEYVCEHIHKGYRVLTDYLKDTRTVEMTIRNIDDITTWIAHNRYIHIVEVMDETVLHLDYSVDKFYNGEINKLVQDFISRDGDRFLETYGHVQALDKLTNLLDGKDDGTDIVTAFADTKITRTVLKNKEVIKYTIDR